MKKKSVAGIFALFFGPLGLHRFYLGQRLLGFIYFVATAILFIISVNVEAPVVLFTLIVGFIDAMLLFSMPGQDFDEKHNRRYQQSEERPYAQQARWQSPSMPRRQPQPAVVASPGVLARATGIEKFRDYDYEGAVEDFKKALEEKFDDPAVHFNLACCYSLLERPDPAFFHLTKAVKTGFVDFDKLEKHDGLSYLRALPEYHEFVKNGYYRTAPLPAPRQDDLLSQAPLVRQPSLLEQIQQLADLRSKGILTEEEYVVQERKVRGE